MKASHRLISAFAALASMPLATPALAEAAAAKIDSGDTAWMIAATGFVLMMSIPGLVPERSPFTQAGTRVPTQARPRPQTLASFAKCHAMTAAQPVSIRSNRPRA